MPTTIPIRATPRRGSAADAVRRAPIASTATLAALALMLATSIAALGVEAGRDPAVTVADGFDPS